MSHGYIQPNKSQKISSKNRGGGSIATCYFLVIVAYILTSAYIYSRPAYANAESSIDSSGSADTAVAASPAGSATDGGDRQDFGSGGQDEHTDQPNTSQDGNTSERAGQQDQSQQRYATQGTPVDKADINALAMAVSFAETGGCKTGTAITYNNCVGIRRNGQFVHYDTTDASLDDFKKVWTNGYGGRFPTFKDAVKYTGNDNPTTWLRDERAEYKRRIEAQTNN